MGRVVRLATATPRSARSLLNRAYTQLGQAESSWARLVEVVEPLALLHGDQGYRSCGARCAVEDACASPSISHMVTRLASPVLVVWQCGYSVHVETQRKPQKVSLSCLRALMHA
jgi:hypothetical protein